MIALALYFLRLGATGFGGPAALADRMRADLVDARGWLSRDEFDLGMTIAAACPGPLAYQLAVFIGFIRRGVAGAIVVALAFAAAPFGLVVAAAASYEYWQASPLARGLFYGAGPIVTLLIARACWNLGRKSLRHGSVTWALAASAAALTWYLGREPLWMFALAAAVGVWRLRPPGPLPRAGVSAPAIVALSAVPAGVAASLFAFFFKTGCFVFGSGLVIVPFLKSAVVDEHGWLTLRQFLDSVTVGLVSPGPVVITATFVGYLVDRLPGALAATAGMFLPAVLFTIAATPWFIRHRQNPMLTGFVRGMTAAVVGVLAGTVPIVAHGAVPDVAAASILLAAAGVTAVWKIPDPILVAAGAIAGAAIFTIGV